MMPGVAVGGMSAPDCPAASSRPSMPRVDAILAHPLFRKQLSAIELAEADRKFCRHGLQHLLDVARVAWIRVLEQGVPDSRELVYAAALLHDIGRAAEYATGESHDEAGERIARRILGTLDHGKRFSPDEVEAILDAVSGHRSNASSAAPLTAALRYADKASRACFACPARAACNWPDEKKNLEIAW